MNDRDILSRAASELRAAHSGRRQGAGFTRARIMNTLHQRRQRKLLRWAIMAPLLSALIGGSAWAQSQGQWPLIWQTLASAIGVTETPAPSPHPPVELTHAIPTPNAAPAPIPTPAAPAAAAPAAAAAAPAAAARVPAPTSHLRPTPSRSATTLAVPPQTSPLPPEIPPDPELAAFRSAHELHVAQNHPREAIEAFARYTEQFPNGRFVPEARYNSALNHVRLGEKAAARRALEPFAAGTYGDYRRAEAQRLLEALR